MLRDALAWAGFTGFAFFALCCANTPSSGTGDAPDASPTTDAAANLPAQDAKADARPHADAGEDADDGLIEIGGRLLDGQNRAAVGGATVSWAGKTGQSTSTGDFAVRVAPNLTTSPSITASGYYQFNFQELTISGPSNFGPLFMISQSTASLLQSVLIPDYDATKGVLAVLVSAQGTCSSTGGTTIAVSPAGGAKVLYFSGGLPSTSQLSVSAQEEPSALLYNVEPNVALTLTLTSPTCTQVAFPVTESTVTYTGAIKTAPGDQFTFARVFLK